MKPTAQLRQLLQAPGLIVAPGAYDAFSARLIEKAGFPAVYMTGSGTAAAHLGVPDVGLLTMTEMVENAARIAQAVRVPVIADADTGYGNPINVHRTVREYERAGVAAIHIEDQIWPKKCGHFEGKRLIPKEEMAQKVRAAVEARQDQDFIIIARCDAIAVTGLEDALDRGRAYAQAGADALFIESPLSREHIEIIARSFEAPLLFNMGASGKTPFMSTKEVEQLGYKIMIFPTDALCAAGRAIEELMAHIRETGRSRDSFPRMMTFLEYTSFVGLAEVKALEQRYGVS